MNTKGAQAPRPRSLKTQPPFRSAARPGPALNPQFFTTRQVSAHRDISGFPVAGSGGRTSMYMAPYADPGMMLTSELFTKVQVMVAHRIAFTHRLTRPSDRRSAVADTNQFFSYSAKWRVFGFTKLELRASPTHRPKPIRTMHYRPPAMAPGQAEFFSKVTRFICESFAPYKNTAKIRQKYKNRDRR